MAPVAIIVDPRPWPDKDMTTEELRTHFPQLGRSVYGKPLVYLDNAATSLRPQETIDKWTEISATKTANLHRAVHCIAPYI